MFNTLHAIWLKATIYSALVLEGACIEHAINKKDTLGCIWSLVMAIGLVGFYIACDFQEERRRRRALAELEGLIARERAHALFKRLQ